MGRGGTNHRRSAEAGLDNTKMITFGLNLLTGILFLVLGLGILENRRQVRELGQQVSSLQKDFLAEVAIRYGGDFDGEE